ncbi:hypothetical protein HZB93_00500 [Candidatus Falkowbacteria bacterium]|nr:hypothetical protein [Candidatus Falkowbacteria bacterium]
MSDITKQLKALRNSGPRTEWKKSNREFLMSEVKRSLQDSTAGEKWALELSKIVFPWRVMKLAARPVLALVSVVALVLGSGLSVSASQLALPGDALYGLKIASEKVQVALTFDKKESAKIHVELAGKRINEIKQIKGNTDSDQKKIQKINVAMDKFKEEISTVQNKLESLKNESSAETTVEVAKIVDNKATEYQEDLVQATNELPELNDATQNINQSLDLADETSDAALAMIVEKHTQGEMIFSGEMEEDVLERVGEKIGIVEVKVAEVQGQVSDLTLPVDPAATLVAQQTADQAKVVLGEAKEALDQKDLEIALTKTIESKELVKQAEQIAADAITVAANLLPAPCEGCSVNENPDLTNSPESLGNTNPDVNVTPETNTNTVKVYTPVKVVPPPPPPEPVIDESTLKVGIDLTQDPSATQ